MLASQSKDPDPVSPDPIAKAKDPDPIENRPDLVHWSHLSIIQRMLIIENDHFYSLTILLYNRFYDSVILLFDHSPEGGGGEDVCVCIVVH